MHKRVQNLSKEVKDIKRATMFNTGMMVVFFIWSFVKPELMGESTVSSGNVATNLSISGNDAATNRADSGSDEEILKMAARRGYFTASEYARYRHLSLDTIYRKLNNHTIEGASKVKDQWHIPLPDGR